MDIIKSENNIYFFVFATLLITVLKKFIPNNIIDLFNGEPYNVAMLIIMIYIGKTNIILAIILLIFSLFSSTLHITKLQKSKSNIEGNNKKPIEEFNTVVKPFIIRPEYFTKYNQHKINNESFTLENDIHNYSTGTLNYESELFTGMTF